jgi:thiol-disulfide isomerase/thioredoxin
MKKLLYIVGVLAFLASCTPKNQVVITGEIAELENGMLFLKVKESKQWLILDSCKIEKGKFKMSFQLEEPRLAFLVTEPETEMFQNLPIFLESGNIQITINESDGNPIISGSKLHDEYTDAINKLDAIDHQYEALIGTYNQAQQEGDITQMAAAKLEMDSLDNAYLASIKNHINAHSSSPVSVTLVTTQLIYYLSLQEMKEIKTGLDTSLYHTKAIQPLDERISVLQKFEPGQTVEEISLPDTSGTIHNLSELRGKYVLLDFWASWCGPCRRENPTLVAVYQKFQNRGFDIYAISLDKSREAWINAIEKDNLTWTHVSELKGWEGAVSQSFGIISIPSNLLLDPEGKVISRNVFGEQLEEILTPLLPEPQKKK